MALTLNVTFDLVTADHAGDIRLYVSPSGENPSGDFKVYWGVTGPDGISHKSYPSTPDATFPDNSVSEIFVRIPKDSAGAYLPGDYEIRLLLVDSDVSPNIYALATLDVPFQPYNSGTNPTSDIILSIESDYNCETGNITSLATLNAENPVYSPTLSIESESITITPESATGEDVYSTGDNEIVAGNFAFYSTNADYVVDYQALITWFFFVEEAFTVYIMENVSISQTVNVQCTLPDLCKVASCLEKEFKRLDAKACGNGWESLSEKEKGKFGKASAIARLILLYKACGNDTKYREYVTDFETLMGYSCGCGEDTSDGPQAYTAPDLFIDD